MRGPCVSEDFVVAELAGLKPREISNSLVRSIVTFCDFPRSGGRNGLDLAGKGGGL